MRFKSSYLRTLLFFQILYHIYSREEELRGREISGQELLDRFSSVQSSYNASTDLVKLVLYQSSEKLGEREDTRELKRILREITQRTCLFSSLRVKVI